MISEHCCEFSNFGRRNDDCAIKVPAFRHSATIRTEITIYRPAFTSGRWLFSATFCLRLPLLMPILESLIKTFCIMTKDDVSQSKMGKILLPLVVVLGIIYIFKGGYAFGQWLYVLFH